MKTAEITWIKEDEAAKMLNLAPFTLRRYAKWGRLDIAFTTSIGGRKYQYDKAGINKVLLDNSTITNK